MHVLCGQPGKSRARDLAPIYFLRSVQGHLHHSRLTLLEGTPELGSELLVRDGSQILQHVLLSDRHHQGRASPLWEALLDGLPGLVGPPVLACGSQCIIQVHVRGNWVPPSVHELEGKIPQHPIQDRAVWLGCLWLRHELGDLTRKGNIMHRVFIQHTLRIIDEYTRKQVAQRHELAVVGPVLLGIPPPFTVQVQDHGLRGRFWNLGGVHPDPICTRIHSITDRKTSS
mmetsp:Transcript_53600/g.122680  ORF Transcript_53600/g.122680 Transcript_53600/m.122680 type:complete len:228 (-) Transcript_53600:791-1474(-)